MCINLFPTATTGLCKSDVSVLLDVCAPRYDAGCSAHSRSLQLPERKDENTGTKGKSELCWLPYSMETQAGMESSVGVSCPDKMKMTESIIYHQS